MKIAMCASEVVPFAKTGGLADVVGTLPLALERLGEEVIVIMPQYKVIQDSGIFAAKTGGKIQRLKDDIYYSVVGKNIKIYFIKNDVYFNRDGLYGDKNGDHKDNLDRFSYFSRRALELFKEIDFKPDIIHVHDWQAALIPVYLKTRYIKNTFYKNIKTVLTIHNIGYQGIFSKEEFPKLGLDWALFNMEGLEFYGKINILKGGIVFSDLINTVSPTYSREIQTSEFGFGLEGILKKRRESLFGILNGLDYKIWNPLKDKFIVKNYSSRSLQDKYQNKKDLLRVCALPEKKGVPLFGIVSRLAEQKGFDILSQAIDTIRKINLQLVILGTGELKYHRILEAIAKKYPRVVRIYLRFDDPLAHKIYAGSDVFLMPSKYEPCGLGQMISLKYGTIPLVFKTGGLADTVTEDNGFVFANYKKEGLIKTVEEAVRIFNRKKEWDALMRKAMGCNFSWEESAKKYLSLYEKAKSR